MDGDPTARSLTLLSLLQSRTEWAAADLAERLGTSVRTVRRDAQRLRGLGYAIRARPGPGSTYRLVPGLSIPPLLFGPDEVTAVVAGLRLMRSRSPDDDAAARALTQLDQVLPGRLRLRAAATDLATEVLDDGSPAVATADIGTVADAVADDGRIRFRYLDQKGRSSTRLVDPHRHVLGAGRWYLLGYDIDRRDWRTFRFDRVSAVERVPGTYRRREFPHDSIGQWLATDFGRLAPHGPVIERPRESRTMQPTIDVRWVTHGDAQMQMQFHRLVHDVVAGGGAVGYLAPPTTQQTDALLHEILASVSAGDAALAVALVDGRVDAVGLWQRRPGAPFTHAASLEKVMAHPDARGLGLGRLIVTALIGSARDAGIETLALGVRGNNHGAIELYEQLGFRVWGRQPDVIEVGDERFDDVRMALDLGRPPSVILRGSTAGGPGSSPRRDR